MLVIDAEEGVTEQDQRLAGRIEEEGRACLVVVNKWDLVEKDSHTMPAMEKELRSKLYFLEWAPMLFISALTGQRVERIFPLAVLAVEQHRRRVTTAVVNEVLQEALSWRSPPTTGAAGKGGCITAPRWRCDHPASRCSSTSPNCSATPTAVTWSARSARALVLRVRPCACFGVASNNGMLNGIRPVLPAANGLAAAAPLGQYVAGRRGWLRRLDPRLKYAWSLAFLITPILASPWWRLALVGLLLLITLASGLPWRLWRRSVPLLLALSLAVGLLAAVLPSPREQPQPVQRPPQELQLSQPLPAPPAWELWQAGPLRITRRSAELGVNSATLLFTVMQSANLLLVSTPPEALAWGLTALLAPLAWLGVPVERLGFQLLLALRFLPLVQEELQNLLRAVATRALNLQAIGLARGHQPGAGGG